MKCEVCYGQHLTRDHARAIMKIQAKELIPDTESTINLRLELEALICEREGMIAANSQYSQDKPFRFSDFQKLAAKFRALKEKG